MSEEHPLRDKPWNQLLLTLATLAFTSWAGVVVWLGNSIIDQLSLIERSVQEMDGEIEEFKLSQSERLTRLETIVQQMKDDRYFENGGMYGPSRKSDR